MGKLGRRLVGQAMAVGQKEKITQRYSHRRQNGSGFWKTTDLEHRSHCFEPKVS
jgi:hypothetical protein